MRKNGEILTGMKRYERQSQIILRGLIAGILISAMAAVLIWICDSDSYPNLYLIFVFVVFILATIMVLVDNHSNKKTLNNRAEVDFKCIEKLNEILTSEITTENGYSVDFKIDSRDKVLGLLELYQPYLRTTDQNGEVRYRIWTSLIGVAGTIVAAVITNNNLLSWYGFFLELILLIYFGLAVVFFGFAIPAIKQLNPKKIRYEGIVKDLKMLLLKKYPDSNATQPIENDLSW